ncbi:glycosyltransferase [Jannaschia sp. W003]|uniref:glycosyltransferase n=1 Tax=Jannaschia sp. W003 TaxID=2867012 RepID=UPI0021A7E8B6|nr:glycosyltransferase [Jannaschia sp. W003]UWQ19986.1 glycosyltransferase [Jannaschia sp. W003]
MSPSQPPRQSSDANRALIERARGLRKQARWEAALEVLAEGPSGYATVRLESARNLLALQRSAEALALLGAHPMREPERQLARLAGVLQGEGSLEAGDVKLARAHLRAMEAQGITGFGREMLLRALYAAAPDAFDVARRLVDGWPEEAEALLPRFEGAAATRAALWLRVARRRRGAGDLAGASRGFAAALQHEDAPEARLAAAEVLLRRNRGAEALALLKALDTGGSGSVRVGIARARAHEAARDFPGALRCWRMVLDLDPANLAALRGAARALQTDKNLAGAFATARRAMRHPEADFSDVRRVARLLRVMNRNAVLDRFLARAAHRHGEGRLGAHAFAWLLLASDLPGRAEAVLRAAGDLETGSAEDRALYLRCLIARLDYIAAAAFLAAHPDAGAALSHRDRGRVATAEALARDWDETDNDALHGRIIARMLDLGRDPRFGYDPEPGKMLLTCSSLGLGGAERQTVNLAQALAGGMGGVARTALLVTARRDTSYALRNGAGSRLDVHYMREVDAVCDGDALSESSPFEELQRLEDLLDLGGTTALMRAFRQLRPEMLSYRVGPVAQTVIASVIAGVPRTLIRFGSMTRRHQSNGSELFDLRERIVTRVCRAAAPRGAITFASNSRMACDEWADQIGLDPARMRLIRNGLDEAGLGDPAPERAVEVRRALGIPADAFVVGGVFRFEPVKDPMLWIETVARVASALPDCHFLLVGHGPLREAMLRRAEEGGFAYRLHMPGAVFSGLRAYYGAMNAFLLTSHTESLPNVVIEAQISGVPVVVTNAGGVREGIATDESGRVAEGRSPDELAALVQGYHDDPALRARVAREAPEVIRERFSVAQMVRSTLACFDPHPRAEATAPTRLRHASRPRMARTF